MTSGTFSTRSSERPRGCRPRGRSSPRRRAGDRRRQVVVRGHRLRAARGRREAVAAGRVAACPAFVHSAWPLSAIAASGASRSNLQGLFTVGIRRPARMAARSAGSSPCPARTAPSCGPNAIRSPIRRRRRLIVGSPARRATSVEMSEPSGFRRRCCGRPGSRCPAARAEVEGEEAPVAADDRVAAEDEPGRLVDLAGIATQVVIKRLFSTTEFGRLPPGKQRLLGFRVVGDVLGDVMFLPRRRSARGPGRLSGARRAQPEEVLPVTVKSTSEADWT